MSIPEATDARGNFRIPLDVAHRLVDMGTPIFVGRLTPEGVPDRADRRWDGWQKTKPSHELVDKWRPGLALCAVTGVTYDVLDYDPRNGGERSLAQMDKELGDDGPQVYWEVQTPSHGRHFWIAPLGIGKHTGFLPGLDLQGGKADGTSRGFVYLPPTVRTGIDGKRRAYRALRPLKNITGEMPSETFRAWVERCLERKGSDSAAGRVPADKLRTAVLKAGPGEQRGALLRYVHELERKGYERPDILVLLRSICGELKNYDARNPWYPARGGDPDKWLNGLLHRPGTIIGDAKPEEVAGLKEMEPKRAVEAPSDLLRSILEVQQEYVDWLWEGYLSFGDMTVLDGEKGQAKSFITIDILARATRGLPMPGSDTPLQHPISVVIFTDESNAGRELKPRLMAAGADESKVFIPKLPKKRGDKEASGLVLPDSGAMFGRMIRACGAQIAVWDPITDFMAEDIQTHNDASVRRALRPLGQVLTETGCAGWLIRHMNKDSGARAKFRGAGTTAFQNRARVHLVTGVIPAGSGDGQFGLAVVDSNLRRKTEGVLAYNIIDSDIKADRSGNMVGKVEWVGYVEVDADVLTGARAKRRGPFEAPEQEQLRLVLEEMFTEQETWSVAKAEATLKAAGCSLNKVTLQKVKAMMGIRSIRVAKRGAVGVDHWAWTIKKDKISESE